MTQTKRAIQNQRRKAIRDKGLGTPFKRGHDLFYMCELCSQEYPKKNSGKQNTGGILQHFLHKHPSAWTEINQEIMEDLQ